MRGRENLGSKVGEKVTPQLVCAGQGKREHFGTENLYSALQRLRRSYTHGIHRPASRALVF